MMRCQAEERDPTAAEVEAFRESMSAFMLLPGERASFTVSDIAAESSLAPDRVSAVLGAFSIEFDGTRDAAAAVGSFLRGVNPLARTCLIRDPAGNYLMAGSQIGTDSFRVIAETALKADGKAWRHYDRTRADVSEAAALAAVSRAVGTPATYPNLSYYAPRHGQDVTALGPTCPSLQAVGDPTECDGLFIIGDVAICVEVKGRTIAGPARRGDRARLTTEIKKIFGEGARQAQRLEQLISCNHGVWRGDGSWLDLSGIREVRAIVAGLDDFGPLTVADGVRAVRTVGAHRRLFHGRPRTGRAGVISGLTRAAESGVHSCVRPAARWCPRGGAGKGGCADGQGGGPGRRVRRAA